MMFIVYSGMIPQSIPLDLGDAIHFARESNMNCDIRCEYTEELVYESVDDPWSPFYVEIECDMPVWGESHIDALEWQGGVSGPA